MIPVLYNALQLTGQFSGVQYTEEALMRAAFLHPFPDIAFTALCPKTYQSDFSISPPSLLTHVNLDSSCRCKRIAYEHFCMGRGSRSVLHCPAYVLPWRWPGKSVVTVHDTIALDYPAYCTFANQWYFRFALPRSIKRANQIIAVSQTVKKDIIRRFPFVRDKIKVIYHGISPLFNKYVPEKELERVKDKYFLPEKFILFVGNIEPKKNLIRLLKAYELLCRKSDKKYCLVIAGRFAWKYNEVLRKIKNEMGEGLYCPGYIDLPDLPALYRLADLFVFPSLYEGFGIPPLEAMACGVPTIVSTAGALSEITGGCAYLVDPLSVESIARGMDEVLHNGDLRDCLQRKGLLQVKQFTWEKAWSATAAVYRNVENQIIG